jgi:lipopolysaccharide transport system permease protein
MSTLSSPALTTPPHPTVVIQRRRRVLDFGLEGLWPYRELLYFLVWRDVKVRYKQTAIGAAWAVLQPLVAMAIFTVIFGYFASIPSNGVPYPLFAFAALLPWNLFSQALTRGAASLVTNAHLLTKVYFPRVLIPVSATMLPVVDFGVSMVALAGLMAWYGVTPTWRIATLPLFLALAFLAAVGLSLILSPINVRYRDVGHVVPFLVQVWMYASPVVYPLSLVPERWRVLYSLNPMVSVIEGVRWALLQTAPPDITALLVSAAMMVGLLLGALICFRRLDATFADVV